MAQIIIRMMDRWEKKYYITGVVMDICSESSRLTLGKYKLFKLAFR